MTGFLTITVLICSLNIQPKYSKDLFCFDKGIQNLRGTEIDSFAKIEFFKCNDRYFKDCNTEFSKMEGCKFVLKNKTVYHSSLTCP